MASLDLDVSVAAEAVAVTNRADGSKVTEDQVFTERANETITLWQGSGLSISAVLVSGETSSDWPGTSTLRRSPTPGILQNAQKQPLLRVEFKDDRVVLTDLNTTPNRFNYKFGIHVSVGGTTYQWDPRVHEEPPSTR